MGGGKKKRGIVKKLVHIVKTPVRVVGRIVRPKKTHKKRSCKAVRRRFNAHKASVLRAIKHWRRKYRKCRSRKCRHRVLKRRRRLVRRLRKHHSRAKRALLKKCGAKK